MFESDGYAKAFGTYWWGFQCYGPHMTHMGLYKIPKIANILKKVEEFNFRLAQILTNYPGYI